MSNFSGADITQDGLIWCADISNHKSYQTGSFELNDLVTPKHSGSFSSENSSQIYFGSESGSANYLGCGNAYGITFSDGSSTNLNGSDYTILTWVSFNSFSGADQTWFGKGSNDEAGLALNCGNRTLHVGCRQSSWTVYNSSWPSADAGLLQTHTWYLLGMSHDGTNVKSWGNGKLRSTHANSNGLNCTTGNEVIMFGSGTWQNGLLGSSYASDNRIAWAGIWNRALSAADHLEFFNNTKARFSGMMSTGSLSV